MEDMEVSRREIQEAYQEVLDRYPVDPQRVIVGGFSAGGVTALDLVLQGALPIQGFVTLCPPMPEGFSAEAVAAARDRGVRGTILTTEMDPRVEDQREMVTVMEREGLPLEFFVAPNTGHWYPTDLAERIDQALEHIRAGGS
jgi:acetyl esterase/lipase